jgi:hypothetical protein
LESRILIMKRDLLWTVISVGLIIAVGTLAVVLGGIPNASNLAWAAERWELLMRHLRR